MKQLKKMIKKGMIIMNIMKKINKILWMMPLFILLLIGCDSTSIDDATFQNDADEIRVITREEALTELRSHVNQIDPRTGSPTASINASQLEIENVLPDINVIHPLTIVGENDIDAEIFVSPEKASDGLDGLFLLFANDFNDQNLEIDGRSISVSIRAIPSGVAVDYINSGRHIPDAFSPSNIEWGELLNPGRMSLITERTVGNTSGIIIHPDTYSTIETEHGVVELSQIVESVSNGESILGYTNPLTSSSGLNLMVELVDYFNETTNQPDEALTALLERTPAPFQTTLQLREAIRQNAVHMASISYQTFINTPELNSYIFVPIGNRQDSPMYISDQADDLTAQVVDAFVQFILTDENQQIANDYGFNNLDDYTSARPDITREVIISAQENWRNLRSTARPIVAVFVTDVSGSMRGTPIQTLQSALLNSMQYITSNTYVGIVSYSNIVTIELPIAPFDMTQRAYFTGVVENFTIGGSTATYNATLVALDMILEAMEEIPNATPLLFVLSDGEANSGFTLEHVSPMIRALEIPIIAIGYNAEPHELDELYRLANINESIMIDATNEDIIHHLRQLFNTEL